MANQDLNQKPICSLTLSEVCVLILTIKQLVYD